jgi:beta-glucosidase
VLASPNMRRILHFSKHTPGDSQADCGGTLLLAASIALALAAAACGSAAPAPSQTPVIPALGPIPAGARAGTSRAAEGDVQRRAEDLLSQMSLEEKIAYVGGDRGFYIRPMPRLGLPEIKFSDGPTGCRNWGPSTAYPASIGLAATFDRALAERVGTAMGRDCRARGVHVLLGPAVNIQRSPLNGRNFEYMGEDPYLAGQTASSVIVGVQREGVLATVKHFAANNQEWDRNGISSKVDERTLREIYFPAFESAVRGAHVAAVMTAYNLLNGTYCSHNPWLLKQVLGQDWGFSGFVMSDWGAVHDTEAAAASGLDLEMPSGKYLNDKSLLPLLESKALAASEIDGKVRHILQTLISAGFLDRPQTREDIPLDDPASAATALAAARESLVLLKNEGGLLPLDPAHIKVLAVVGPNADPLVHGGSGSAFVTPLHHTSLLEAIKQLAPGVQVLHHPGVRQVNGSGPLGQAVFMAPVKQEIFAGQELAGVPLSTSTIDRIAFNAKGRSPAPGVPAEHYSIRWTGQVNAPKAGSYTLITHTDDGVRAFVDGKKVIDAWSDHAARTLRATLDLRAGPHALVIEYYQALLGSVAEVGFEPASREPRFEGAQELAALVKRADAVIVSVGYGQSTETNSYGRAFEPFWPPSWARDAGLVEAEDSDRPFELPRAQLETLRTVSAANPHSVVVANAGGGVAFQGWLAKTPALLWAWYPGQEGGTAVAEVLFGVQNPSGKLPVTFAKAYADHPAAAFYNISAGNETPYGEGIFVGYRGFDKQRIQPQFPFGHGLSYTEFAYRGLRVAPAGEGTVKVELTVENVGKRAGEEVVQIYVAPPAGDVPRPPRELKGYARVALAPGESRAVELTLGPRAFAHWANAWSITPGTYEIGAGASSRDIRLEQGIELAAANLPSSVVP